MVGISYVEMMYLWHVFMAYYIYNLFIKELHAFLLLAFTQELLAELHLFSHHAEVFDDQHLVAPHWKIKLMYLHTGSKHFSLRSVHYHCLNP